MTPFKRRTLLGVLGSGLLTACAAPSVVTRDRPKDPFEGGIGGTGIVGVMTDFGSLIVNGLRVEVTGRTRVITPYGPSTDSMISRGMSLAVVADRSADRLVAQHVQVAIPLVGTVASGPGGELTVNGARLLREPGAIGTANLGLRVIAHGVWSQQGLVASRIDSAGTTPDLIGGVVTRGGPTGVTIEGVPIRGTGGQSAAATGEYLTAIGRYSDGTFDAQITRRGRFVTGAGSLRQLSVEGYLAPSNRAPGFRIAGLGHSFARDLQLKPLAQRRAVYFGRYNGLFGATSGYVVPGNFTARRALLRDGYDAFSGPIVRTRS